MVFVFLPSFPITSALTMDVDGVRVFAFVSDYQRAHHGRRWCSCFCLRFRLPARSPWTSMVFVLLPSFPITSALTVDVDGVRAFAFVSDYQRAHRGRRWCSCFCLRFRLPARSPWTSMVFVLLPSFPITS